MVYKLSFWESISNPKIKIINDPKRRKSKKREKKERNKEREEEEEEEETEIQLKPIQPRKTKPLFFFLMNSDEHIFSGIAVVVVLFGCCRCGFLLFFF